MKKVKNLVASVGALEKKLGIPPSRAMDAQQSTIPLSPMKMKPAKKKGKKK